MSLCARPVAFYALLATAPRTLDWLQFNGQSLFPVIAASDRGEESGKGVFEQAPLESVFGLTPCRNGGDSPLLPWPTMGFPLRSINDAPYNALRLNDLATAVRVDSSSGGIILSLATAAKLMA